MQENVPGTDLSFELISYDRHGVEVTENGALVSDALTATVSDPTAPITDVFVMVHGWQADQAGAIASYKSWLGAVAKALETNPRPGVNPRSRRPDRPERRLARGPRSRPPSTSRTSPRTAARRTTGSMRRTANSPSTQTSCRREG
jgi:hypothetical protein